ncbi:TRAP transporter substrate-binding protein [Tropicimonas sp. IMCC34011]|uniref:TRAP transporter substrate-binding protein n=1 Tax=Tropicimonas sp. IMCC34011 TaxID=2248759 RepID=UPI001300ABF3|nr:TRAP transporter substrate-binding protein [Tropicimonas sp. IMCC34011]
MKPITAALWAGVSVCIALPAAAQDLTIRVGTVYQPDHTISKGTAEFARIVEEESGGSIEVQPFYSEELGTEREMAEMTRAGGMEMVLSGLPGTGAFVPQLEVMEAFYTYGDVEDLARVVEAISPDLNGFMEPQGFHMLGAMYQGPRNLLANEPVRTLADIEGMKMRIPQTPLFVTLAQSWGATPTAIAFSEAYTALENGVVDAIDGTAESMVTSGFSEQVKNLTLTRHNFYPQPMVVNLDWWNGLTDEQRAILEDAAARASEYQLGLHTEAANAAIARMEEEGVTIIEPDNIEEFREPVLAAMDGYIKDKGDDVYAVYQKMLEVAGSDED